MKRIFMFILASALVMVLLPWAWPVGAEEKPSPLRFGTLPVIQALPIFVAAEMGLFEAEGLTVEFIPFKTAMEKEAAMAAGQLDGYFGDLFTPIILLGAKVDLKLTAVNFTTGQGQRMFAVMAGTKSKAAKIADLAGLPVAASSNTIIDYVTRTLLERGGVPADKIELIETKNIPLRYQMLLSNQVEAATLPEPLVTLAEKQGAKVLADDGDTPLTSTVVVFTKDFIDRRPEDVKKFHAALAKAAEVIGKGDPAVREIMNRNCGVPQPLQDSYPVPAFPAPTVPDQAKVEAAVKWLTDRGVLKSALSYDQIVDGGFIR